MNQATAELVFTTNYVEDYFDCIESLPNDLQRNVSQMREVDSSFRLILKQTRQYYEELTTKQLDPQSKKKVLFQLHRSLLRSQELGDEKLNLASQIVEVVENRLRQIDYHKGHVEMAEKPKPVIETNKEKSHKAKREAENGDRSSKRPRRHRSENEKEKEKEKEKQKLPISNVTNDSTKSKKKKRSKKVVRDPSPVNVPIDPNEPTYCLCNQVSYGEMVGCDYKECPYEWFHFGCVGLNHKPKGKWYCPNCIPLVKKK